MASLESTIKIIFGAQDQTNGAIRNIAGQIDNLDGAIQGAAAPFAGLANQVLDANKALGLFVAAMAAAATATAGKFNAGVKEIGTLFDATDKQVEQLSESLLQYGRDSISSFEQIQEASYIAISTGTAVADTTKTLSAAEKLAAAGATELNVATGALTRSLNAYGQGAELAQAYSEALFTAVQKGDTTMADLAANIGNVATVASTSGVKFDELLAAMDGMTIAGINTAQSTTILKSLFTELSSPSKELEKALGGMTVKANGLQAVMQQLKTATGGSQAKMDELFGSSEAMTGALVLANDAAGAFAGALDAMEKKAGKLDAAYESMTDTFENNNQRFINNLQATLIEVGTPLLDDYGRTIEGFNDILKGFGEGIKAPNFQAIYDVLDQFSGRLSTFLSDLGSALPEAMAKVDLSGLGSALVALSSQVGDAFGSIFGEGLDLSSADGLAIVLQKITNLITALVQVAGGIIDEMQPVFDFIGRAAEDVGGLDEAMADMIGNFLGAAKLLNEFGTALGAAIVLIKESDTDVRSVMDNILNASIVIINAMQSAFDLFAGAIFETGGVLANALSVITFGDLSDEFERAAKNLDLAGDAASANLSKNFMEMSDAWDNLNKKSAETTDSISTDVEKVRDSADKLPTAFNGAADAVNGLKEAGQGVAESINVDKLVEQSLDGIKAANALKTELATIASNERIKISELNVELEKLNAKNFKATIELEIAQAKANVEIIKTSLSSLDGVIKSTGNVLSALFGQLSDASWTDAFDIRDQIEAEREMREEAARQQRELIQAQIDYFEQKSRALQNGLSEITVTADGLEPELEAFMWAILERVKLRATQEQSAFLLGL